MTDIMSREIQLVSRPNGMPTADNFAIATTKLEPLQAGQVLVRNLYMSVDPYMRGRMSDRKSYVPPFALGKSVFEKFSAIKKAQKSPQRYSLSIYKKTKTVLWKQQRNHTPQT